MAGRSTLSAATMIIAPIGIAIWILATYTLGKHLDEGSRVLIGFAVGLFAVAITYCLLFFASGRQSPQVSMTLIICGTCCIVVAVALQIYLAAVTAQNSQRLMEILSESMKTQPSANMNVKSNYPKTVEAVSYLAVFAGMTMAAVGARFSVGTRAGSGGKPKADLR